jgi:hypothetical protein
MFYNNNIFMDKNVNYLVYYIFRHISSKIDNIIYLLKIEIICNLKPNKTIICIYIYTFYTKSWTGKHVNSAL